ncbi:hypothetical protein FAF44_36655 [Nonomuraea sp. MG754425]|uniref:hypothetical protein n=1 Tax=Nonomuraea sp. MG754425 TaxID=2570319 RepID=UPI001F201800|nr:hypothetical protein [Nonomuraea sp. MG754425]MCF6473873.1 hypothetical protein [Nonomuraea sp. MG754425]
MNLTQHPLTDFEQRLVNVAAGREYELTHLLVKVCELRHPTSCVTIYLDRQRNLRQAIRVKIHPETSGEMLEAIEGIQGLSIKPDLFHHANMRRFPKRLNGGKEKINFARAVVCADITAFDRLLQTLAVE